MTHRALFSILLAGALAACSDATGPEAVASIEFGAPTLFMASGAESTVVVSTLGKRGKTLEGRPLSFSIADSTVATVDANGRVRAQVVTGPSQRQTVMTATSGGATGSVNVVVARSPVAAITFSVPAVSLAHGETAQLVTTLRDANANVLSARQLTYDTRDSNVVRVDESGALTTVGFLGASNKTAYVTASSEGILDSIAVTVGPTTVASVVVTPETPFMAIGWTRRLRATALSPAGIALAGVPFSWTSSVPSVASINSLGVVTAAAQGETIVNATTNGVTSNAFLTVNTCGNAPAGDYPIEVRFTAGGGSPAITQAFNCAVLRISAAIREPLSPVLYSAFNASACATDVTLDETVPGLVIFATIEPIDGPGRVLGSAGPCYVRQDNSLTSVGRMRFDVADLDNMVSNGTIGAVIMHEMLHVIGIGTLWTTKGLLTGLGSNPRFEGPLATAACLNDHGGTGICTSGVLVEDCVGISGCGAGTIHSHWRDLVFKNELMTGYVNGGFNPFSRMSIQSLADLGYGVDPLQADDYSLLPPASAMLMEASGATVKMPAPLMPLGRVDRLGRFTPLPR
jgi:hypothetical protein